MNYFSFGSNFPKNPDNPGEEQGEEGLRFGSFNRQNEGA